MIQQVTFDVLKKSIIEKKYANIALKQIDHPNIALITQLVYGTIQNYRFCLYQWEDLIKTHPKKEIEILINLAVYQMFFINKMPDYAIVDESTKIAGKLFDGRYKAFVNAILRKLSTQDLKYPPLTHTIESLAIIHSFPSWILHMWNKQYGEKAMRDFAMISHEPPKIYVKENNLSPFQDLDELSLIPTQVKGCYIAERSILKHVALKEGHVIIQDKNAQQVSHFTPIKAHEKVLDACAAPGGKSISMAIKTEDQCEIVAVDIHPHRVKLIDELIHKTKIKSIRTMIADATDLSAYFSEGSFDGVLVDAPCSGLGVLRRKPDIKLFITPEDLDQIIQLQQDILLSVASLVKVGGWLVYATCTINKKENEKQAMWFLRKHENFVKIEEQFLDPYKTDADGFYMVKFIRIS